MATYFGTTINDSPTVVYEAGAAISNAQGLIVRLDAGKVKPVAAAGGVCFGVIPLSEPESFASGDDVTVQIKDIGVCIAGAAVAAGDHVMCDANGKAVKATTGKWILGTALKAAAEAGTRIPVQITQSGYEA